MKVLFNSLLLVSLLFFSCKKQNSSPVSTNDYLKITVNGIQYNEDLYSYGSGFTGQTGCISKKHFDSYIGIIENSKLSYSLYIRHLENDIDFANVQIGTFKIASRGQSSICNLDLIALFEDKTLSNPSTTLIAGGTNTISSITKLSSTNTEQLYTIAGKLNCSFKNSANVTIPITGEYQITVDVFK